MTPVFELCHRTAPRLPPTEKNELKLNRELWLLATRVSCVVVRFSLGSYPVFYRTLSAQRHCGPFQLRRTITSGVSRHGMPMSFQTTK